ncbi:Transcriptional regulatory protein TyrR [Pelotomaculum schinkii]|uniref:HTH-type transcriptional regulatory protein TyrR n=1 Tax=Pelotomaculum schinkii TaxID=78350 RepID=A0A4Y7RAI1_9FIRM|nr:MULTISPECIES: sigma 54-interacting transcriptional regulator [Pelotomaculum]TEB05988.1 Transcriptional regulatory protein TyrR [Pelotomaculum schinkii]TEB12450.1 Transcriptional regulatory protein TyrR [Pelotomaculum sp. FP]
MDNPRLWISFEDRVGFVFDISRVIFAWRLNIVSIEITRSGSLYVHIEKIETSELAGLMNELNGIPGVLEIYRVPMMPSEEREKKLQAILDTVSEGILSVDADGIITSINPVAEEIFRYTAAELLGRNIAGVLSSEVPILRCLKDGKPYNHLEISINTPKGRLNFLSTARPLKDDGENIIGAVACIKDMSDVKQLVYSMTKPAMTTFDDILGVSLPLKEALTLSRKVAQGNSTVLIRGESGTGKELFARAIHMASSRRNKPFVPVNCAALPDSLLESELFGYVEGAFTGAQKQGKLGLFEFANNGTILLDEIGEMSTHLQAKLLRVLQEGRVRRIGDRVENTVNVRVIAATNRNLENMITNGDFREDLYYRLNVVPVHIPPLRRRKEDIPILTDNLIQKFNHRLGKNIKKISSAAMDKLNKYNWPGNVRELENILERAMILAQDMEIKPEQIILDRTYAGEKEDVSPAHFPGNDENSDTLNTAVDGFEKQFIEQALLKYGSIRHTAKVLGVSHTTIMNKIKKYGLKVTPI